MASKPIKPEAKAAYVAFEELGPFERLRTQLLSGKALFTLVSKATGKRFTYRLKSGTQDREKNWTTNNQDRTRFFVSVLTGPNNTEDYTYLGTLDGQPESGKPYYYRHGRKSSLAVHADSVRAFSWWAHKFFVVGILPEDCEVVLADQCMRCGRTLTVPESIANHIGPECIGNV